MQREQIRNIVIKLVKKYQTNDPFKLCKYLSIPVYYLELGDNIMGYRTDMYGVSSIVINSNLNTSEQRITCGHELGHDQCGHNDDTDFLRKSSLYSQVYKSEFEANTFMVELMLAKSDLDDVDTQEGVLRSLSIPAWAANYVDWAHVKKMLVVANY